MEIKGLCFAILDQIPSHTILLLKRGALSHTDWMYTRALLYSGAQSLLIVTQRFELSVLVTQKANP